MTGLDVGLAAQDLRLGRRVGAIALALIAAAIVFFVFVYDRIEWGRHVRVRVYFHVTGGLHEGAAFAVAGRAIGVVESIALVPHGTPSPLGGDAGVVAVVAIDAGPARQLAAGGDWFVASRGPLSARFLELGPAPVGAPPIADGDTVLGRDPPSLDRVLQRTWDNMTTLARFAGELGPEFRALRGQIDELRGHLGGAAASTAAVVPAIERVGPLVDDALAIAAETRQLRDGALGGDAGRARVAALVDRARATLTALRGASDRLAADTTRLVAELAVVRARLGDKGDAALARLANAIERGRAVMAKVDALLAQVELLAASLARGEGSLQKLMNDPEFPEDAKELGKILKRQPWRVIGHP